MNRTYEALRIIGSAVLLAIIFLTLVAAAGFLEGSSSTVPVGKTAGGSR